MKQAVLSLSGGMDSSSLLLHLLAQDYQVTALSFNYGQKHVVELQKAKKLVKYLQRKGLPVTHNVITLDGLQPLLSSTLVVGGKEVPEGHYAAENMKDTVVPNRNKMFSSILQAVALSVSKNNESPEGYLPEVIIAMGIHAGDHAIYPDCRQEFRDADYHAFQVGNWWASQVKYYTPYLSFTKFDILKDGLISCKILGLSFKQVYKNTNTSYKPIQIGKKWYADYKSAASVERIEAFTKLKMKDPTSYADETGPVTWEVAQDHALKILSTSPF